MTLKLSFVHHKKNLACIQLGCSNFSSKHPSLSTFSALAETPAKPLSEADLLGAAKGPGVTGVTAGVEVPDESAGKTARQRPPRICTIWAKNAVIDYSW